MQSIVLTGNATNISICMDADLKAQADALFTELGMNLTTAFKVPLYLSPWLVHQFNPRKPFPMISLEFTMAINAPG